LDQSGCLTVRPQSFPLDSFKPPFILSFSSLLLKWQIWPCDDPALKWLIVSMEELCGLPCTHSLLLAGSMPLCFLLKEFSFSFRMFLPTPLSSQVWGRQLDDLFLNVGSSAGCQGQKQRLQLDQTLLFAGPTEMPLSFCIYYVYFFNVNIVCFCCWQERNLGRAHYRFQNRDLFIVSCLARSSSFMRHPSCITLSCYLFKQTNKQTNKQTAFHHFPLDDPYLQLRAKNKGLNLMSAAFAIVSLNGFLPSQGHMLYCSSHHWSLLYQPLLHMYTRFLKTGSMAISSSLPKRHCVTWRLYLSNDG
jgi:hypothetical protein